MKEMDVKLMGTIIPWNACNRRPVGNRRPVAPGKWQPSAR